MFKLFERFKTQSPKQADSRLETKYRRLLGGRSIKEFVQYIWDANFEQGGMGRTLRKRALRGPKDERVREQEERTHARSLRIRDLIRQPGWADARAILEGIESKRFVNLSLPEIRGEKESLDYFIGKQNGALEVIREFRTELRTLVDYADRIKPTKDEVNSIHE